MSGSDVTATGIDVQGDTQAVIEFTASAEAASGPRAVTVRSDKGVGRGVVFVQARDLAIELTTRTPVVGPSEPASLVARTSRRDVKITWEVVSGAGRFLEGESDGFRHASLFLPAAPGRHVVRAVALDSQGRRAESSPCEISSLALEIARSFSVTSGQSRLVRMQQTPPDEGVATVTKLEFSIVDDSGRVARSWTALRLEFDPPLLPGGSAEFSVIAVDAAGAPLRPGAYVLRVAGTARSLDQRTILLMAVSAMQVTEP